MEPVICPYCKSKAKLADSEVIYGRSFGMVWLCTQWPKCNAYVGVHRATNEPLGRLADPMLREAKKKAHYAFDPLWKSGSMSRHEAYGLMAELMGIPREQAHIGMFDVQQCEDLIGRLQTYRCKS